MTQRKRERKIYNCILGNSFEEECLDIVDSDNSPNTDNPGAIHSHETDTLCQNTVIAYLDGKTVIRGFHEKENLKD